jgi:hypothetical protein
MKLLQRLLHSCYAQLYRLPQEFSTIVQCLVGLYEAIDCLQDLLGGRIGRYGGYTVAALGLGKTTKQRVIGAIDHHIDSLWRQAGSASSDFGWRGQAVSAS